MTANVGAAPTGGQVSAGTATITQSGATTTIQQASQKAAIDWAGFSVGKAESVRFNQPNASAITLNRVTGTERSEILGSLSANGQVFILNPNGVLFGKGAQVNVGGLVASTLRMSNDDFMAGNFRLTEGPNARASVSNEGEIRVAEGGVLALIAPVVTNTGTLAAPQGSVLMAAADAVSVTLQDGSLVSYTLDKGNLQALVDNGGIIQAEGGHVVLTAKGLDALSKAVVNHSGVIEAQTVSTKNGVVELLGDMEVGQVNLSGRIDASAPRKGDGGFVETSAAKVKVADSAQVDTRAAMGRTGEWLIDPDGYTIGSGASGDMAGATLSAILATSNASIVSTQGQGTNGNINLNESVSWSANRLSLVATKDIHINADLNGSGTARLALEYGQGAVSLGNTADYHLNSGAKIFLPEGQNFSTKLGSDGMPTAYTVIASLGVEGDTGTTTLQGMKNNPAGNYALGADIDASHTSSWNGGAGWEPVGGEVSNPFSGSFHGFGHVVSGLSIERTGTATTSAIGMFGYSTGLVRSVGLQGVSVIANPPTSMEVVLSVGGLVGGLGGTVTDSYTSGSVVSNWGASSVGGVVGAGSRNSFILNSYSSAPVSGGLHSGGLAGSSAGVIRDSHSSGAVAGYFDAGGAGGSGGLVGYVGEPYGSAVIANSYSTSTVVGGWNGHAGGLVGRATSTTIQNSYSTGSVTDPSASVGGLVGFLEVSFVVNSYSTGAVAGGAWGNAGGLVGRVQGGGSIQNSYSTGRVAIAANTDPAIPGSLGGLVGANFSGSVVNSYWNTETSNQATSSGGVGLSTAQMKQQAGFTGWDFTNIWRIDNGNSFPLLRSFTPNTPEPAQVMLPEGGIVRAGDASIVQSAFSTIINQSTPKLAIDWTLFSVGSSGTVQFNQPGTSAIALNRVTGTESSQILGSLTANGLVFILNPNGVLFGKDAQVSVGGIVASTHQMADTDFMAGSYRLSGADTGSVINQGQIQAAKGGVVGLIAPVVQNTGTLAAPEGSVLLAAGDAATLVIQGMGLDGYSLDSGSRSAEVDNPGKIEAPGGRVVLTAKGLDALSKAVVNHSGIIEAQTVSTKNGVVELLGDMEVGQVNLSGRVDASEGSGLSGGKVETSAANVTVFDSALVSTSSALGYGDWSIRSRSPTIAQSGFSESSSIISATSLSKSLSNGNVSIFAIGNSANSLDININQSVSWTADTRLSLEAKRNININSNLALSGDHAGLSMVYGYTHRDVHYYGGSRLTTVGGEIRYSNGATVSLTGESPFFAKGSPGIVQPYTVINKLGGEADVGVSTLQGINGNGWGYYVLGADIDASATATWNGGKGFAPIVPALVNYYYYEPLTKTTPFVFDGLGHSIRNIYINRPDESKVGLFGRLDVGRVENLKVTGIVSGLDSVGLIAGVVGHSDGCMYYCGASTIEMTTFEGVSAAGSVRGRDYVGGIVGSGLTLISRSSAEASVLGVTNVGGIIGAGGVALSQSYSQGSVTGDANVGGLVGAVGPGQIDGWGAAAQISDSYSLATVAADAGPVGGLVGRSYGGLWGGTPISNTYSAGRVTGALAGGLIGQNDLESEPVSSYWNVDTSGLSSSRGGVGLNNASMSRKANYSGWDFSDVWRIVEGSSYPMLRALTQEKITLTVSAANETKVYNAEPWNPSPSNYISYAGFAAGDNIGSLSGVLRLEGAAIGAVDAGTYGYSGAGLSSQKYEISYLPGYLTITPSPISISGARPYDASNKAYSEGVKSLNGVFKRDEGLVSVVSGSGVLSGVDVGEWSLSAVDTLTLGGDAAKNYRLVESGSKWTVSPRPVVIVPFDVTKTYGNPDPKLNYLIAGDSLLGNDTLTGELGRAPGENAGSYAINKGSLVAGNNYSIQINQPASHLVINQKSLSLIGERVFNGTKKAYVEDVIGMSGFASEEDRKDVMLVPGGYGYLDAAEVGDRYLTSVEYFKLYGTKASNYRLTTANSHWRVSSVARVDCALANSCPGANNSISVSDYHSLKFDVAVWMGLDYNVEYDSAFLQKADYVYRTALNAGLDTATTALLGKLLSYIWTGVSGEEIRNILPGWLIDKNKRIVLELLDDLPKQLGDPDIKLKGIGRDVLISMVSDLAKKNLIEDSLGKAEDSIAASISELFFDYLVAALTSAVDNHGINPKFYADLTIQMAIVSGKVVVKDLILIGSFSKATAAVRDIYMSEALDVINAASAMYQHDPNLNGGFGENDLPIYGLNSVWFPESEVALPIGVSHILIERFPSEDSRTSERMFAVKRELAACLHDIKAGGEAERDQAWARVFDLRTVAEEVGGEYKVYVGKLIELVFPSINR